MFLIGVMPFRDDTCLKCHELRNCKSCSLGRKSEKVQKCIACDHVFELGEIMNVVGEHEFRKGIIPGFGSQGVFCQKCMKQFFKTDKQESKEKEKK